jgi:hypothetical protein
MTKYKCDKGHKFIHPAIRKEPYTVYSPKTPMAIDKLLTIETHVCPFCVQKGIENLNFDEFVEPEADITSVKSVALEDVDTWLAKGYKVHELYSKSAALVLTGEAKQQ